MSPTVYFFFLNFRGYGLKEEQVGLRYFVLLTCDHSMRGSRPSGTRLFFLISCSLSLLTHLSHPLFQLRFGGQRGAVQVRCSFLHILARFAPTRSEVFSLLFVISENGWHVATKLYQSGEADLFHLRVVRLWGLPDAFSFFCFICYLFGSDRCAPGRAGTYIREWFGVCWWLWIHTSRRINSQMARATFSHPRSRVAFLKPRFHGECATNYVTPLAREREMAHGEHTFVDEKVPNVFVDFKCTSAACFGEGPQAIGGTWPDGSGGDTPSQAIRHVRVVCSTEHVCWHTVVQEDV